MRFQSTYCHLKVLWIRNMIYMLSIYLLPIMILTDNRHGECIPAVNAKYFTRVISFGLSDITTLKSVTGVFFHIFCHIVGLNWAISTFTSPSLFIRTSSAFVCGVADTWWCRSTFIISRIVDDAFTSYPISPLSIVNRYCASQIVAGTCSLISKIESLKK